MMKFRRDISSRRLFCKGVPVSSKRCSACTGGREERGEGGRKRIRETLKEVQSWNEKI